MFVHAKIRLSYIYRMCNTFCRSSSGVDCAWVLVPPTRDEVATGYLPLYVPSRVIDLFLSVRQQATCVPLAEARPEHSPTTAALQCPPACSTFTSCDKCVAARHGRPVFEGGYDECYWSSSLRQVCCETTSHQISVRCTPYSYIQYMQWE